MDCNLIERQNNKNNMAIIQRAIDSIDFLYSLNLVTRPQHTQMIKLIKEHGKKIGIKLKRLPGQVFELSVKE